jgi:Histidine kinase-, DNA gyrase B-, and HSP90-like ATPase
MPVLSIRDTNRKQKRNEVWQAGCHPGSAGLTYTPALYRLALQAASENETAVGRRQCLCAGDSAVDLEFLVFCSQLPVCLFAPQAEQQRVDVRLRRPETDLPRVSLDAEKFKQAVLNLVINALEAMPEGGDLVLAASARNGEVLVEVADAGPGIRADIQRDLFKPYVSTKDRGTGMGLALTEKLIGQHEGRIDFRTGPQGTTFFMIIPLEPVLGANGES